MIEWIKNPDQLRKLESEWNRIAAPYQTPLLQHRWFMTCAEIYCKTGELSVMLNRREGEIRAIAPLMKVRRHGYERLELLGTSILYEPSGFLYRSEKDLEVLLGSLIEIGKPLFLGRLDAESPEAALLERFQRGKRIVKRSEGTPYLAMDSTWEKYESTISPEHRSEFRRRKKSLDKRGEVRFEISDPSPDCFKKLFEEFVQVESSGWKGKAGTALACDSRMKEFYSAYAGGLASEGKVRIGNLKVNDRLISSVLAVVLFERLWILKVGFDEEWIQCAPGILMIHEMIRHSFEKGLKGFEFLGKEESWLRRWTKRATSQLTIRYYPYSVQGLHGFATDGLLSVWSKLIRSGKGR